MNDFYITPCLDILRQKFDSPNHSSFKMGDFCIKSTDFVNSWNFKRFRCGYEMRGNCHNIFMASRYYFEVMAECNHRKSAWFTGKFSKLLGRNYRLNECYSARTYAYSVFPQSAIFKLLSRLIWTMSCIILCVRDSPLW